MENTNSGLVNLLKDYKLLVLGSLFLSISTNALNLFLPQLIRRGVDDFALGTLVLSKIATEFTILAIIILFVMYAEAIMQNYVAERVAKEIRSKLSDKIAHEPYSFIEKETPGKLLTNLTSDVDAIKLFVSQASVLIIVSVFTILAASTLLLMINWKLGLAVLAIIPVIAFVFYFAFSKVGILFGKSQGIIDRLNSVISGSILGAAVVRVLYGGKFEVDKFTKINIESRDTGMQILKIFSSLIPVVMFVSNLATIIILGLGGHFVIKNTMTLGELAAFNSYILILLMPIFIIGFMSSVISRAQASYARVESVLHTKTIIDKKGERIAKIKGDIEVYDMSIVTEEKMILRNISFKIKAGSRTAIIGPTAAGKTQLMYALIGLTSPKKGQIMYDGISLDEYDKKSLYSQIGFVFQDSVLFNLSIRENIAFSKNASDKDLDLAIKTAELEDFINKLPNGLDTVVSERGTSLSGGQKQRLMLARALVLNPKILLLDDFTSRVDAITEKRIINNLKSNYPNLTLVSVTQKLRSVESYEKIILLMDGEILALGTHEELIKTSGEYVQIHESQKSTTNYELQS